jgi:hypothetical protein
MASFPDYYAILGVSPTATPDQIKTAYKRKSLVCHPDRVPAGPGSDIKRKAATVEFQAVADSYYTLSDPGASARPLSARTLSHPSLATQDDEPPTTDCVLPSLPPLAPPPPVRRRPTLTSSTPRTRRTKMKVNQTRNMSLGACLRICSDPKSIAMSPFGPGPEPLRGHASDLCVFPLST